jgi:hypothetical protein
MKPLTPTVPDMLLPIVLIGLVIITNVFWVLGGRGFLKRAFR